MTVPWRQSQETCQVAQEEEFVLIHLPVNHEIFFQFINQTACNTLSHP